MPLKINKTTATVRNGSSINVWLSMSIAAMEINTTIRELTSNFFNQTRIAVIIHMKSTDYKQNLGAFALPFTLAIHDIMPL